MTRLGSDPTTGGSIEEEQTTEEDDTADDQSTNELRPDADGDPMREQTENVNQSTGSNTAPSGGHAQAPDAPPDTESQTDTVDDSTEQIQDAKDQTRESVSSGPSQENQTDFATNENPTPEINTGTAGVDGGPAGSPTPTDTEGAPDTSTPPGGAPDQGGIAGAPGSGDVAEPPTTPTEEDPGTPPEEPPEEPQGGGSEGGTPPGFDASGYENSDKRGADVAGEVEQDAVSQYDYLDETDVKVVLVDRDELDEYGIDPSSVDGDGDSFFVPVFSDSAKRDIARHDIASQLDDQYAAVDIGTGDITLTEGEDGSYSGSLTDDAFNEVNEAYFGGSEVDNKFDAVQDVKADEATGEFTDFAPGADAKGEAVGSIQTDESSGAFYDPNRAQHAADWNPDSQAAEAVDEQATRAANMDFAEFKDPQQPGRSTPGGEVVPGPVEGMESRASDPGTPRAALRGGRALAAVRDAERANFSFDVAGHTIEFGGKRGEFEAVRGSDGNIEIQQVDEFEPRANPDSPYAQGVLTFGIPKQKLDEGLDTVISKGRAGADVVGDAFIAGSAQMSATNPTLLFGRQFGLTDAQSVEPDATARLDVEGETTEAAVRNELDEISELSESTPGTRLASGLVSEAAAIIPTYPASAARAASEGGELAAAGIEAHRAGTQGEFRQDVGERAAGTAAGGASTAAERPYATAGRVLGSLIGSAGVMGAAARVGPRAGAAARWSIQPGEEALGAVGYRATRAATSEARAEQLFPNKEPLIFSEEAAIRASRRGVNAARRTGSRASTRVQRTVGEARARAPRIEIRQDADAGLVDVTPAAKRQAMRGIEQRTPSRETAARTASRVRSRVSETRENVKTRVQQGSLNQEMEMNALANRVSNLDITDAPSRAASRVRGRVSETRQNMETRAQQGAIQQELEVNALVDRASRVPSRARSRVRDIRQNMETRAQQGALNQEMETSAVVDRVMNLDVRDAPRRARSRVRDVRENMETRAQQGALNQEMETRALLDRARSTREAVRGANPIEYRGGADADDALLGRFEGRALGSMLSREAAGGLNVRSRLPSRDRVRGLRDTTIRVEPGRPPRRVPVSELEVNEPGGPVVDIDAEASTGSPDAPTVDAGGSGAGRGRITGGPQVESSSGSGARAVTELRSKTPTETDIGNGRLETTLGSLGERATQSSIDAGETTDLGIGLEPETGSLAGERLVSDLGGETELGLEPATEVGPRSEFESGQEFEFGSDVEFESETRSEFELELELESETESETEIETEPLRENTRRRRGVSDLFAGERRTKTRRLIDPLTGR